jgi:hypothetical protein
MLIDSRAKSTYSFNNFPFSSNVFGLPIIESPLKITWCRKCPFLSYSFPTPSFYLMMVWACKKDAFFAK